MILKMNGCVLSLHTMTLRCRDRFIQGLVGIQSIRSTPRVCWESQNKSWIRLVANPMHFSFRLHTHSTPVRVNSTSRWEFAWRLSRWNPLRQPVLKVMTRLSQRFLQMPWKRRASLSKTLRMNSVMMPPMWTLFSQTSIFKRNLSRIVILRGGEGVVPENDRKKSC